MKYNPRTYEAYQLFHDGILALSRAEQAGIRVDLEYIDRKKDHLTRKIERLEERFKGSDFFKHWQHTVRGKVNINSNVQLAHFLYVIKKIKVEKETASGQGATDDEALQKMDIPELEDLLEIRKLKKVRDTYLDSFKREQVNGYIHPFFNLHLVKTYRSSSDSPNFQNIPARDEEAMNLVRKAIFPSVGNQLLEIDFSGLEVRIAACYHKDPALLKYIRDPKSDMHADMAKQIFLIKDFDKSVPSHYILRQAAKNGFVFPEFYGDYYGNCAISMACTWGKLPQGDWEPEQGIEIGSFVPLFLSDHFISKGITSLGEFTMHVKKIENDFWGRRFPDYAEWKERWFKIYQKYGYVDLLTGFRCSGQMGRNDSINYPVQGAAFHCLLWSFIQVDKLILDKGLKSRLIGQIHDSMIIDADPSEVAFLAEAIRRITCEDLPNAWKWIIVPLDVDMAISPIDGSWADKSKLN